jgi:hypothetical protein
MIKKMKTETQIEETDNDIPKRNQDAEFNT